MLTRIKKALAIAALPAVAVGAMSVGVKEVKAYPNQCSTFKISGDTGGGYCLGYMSGQPRTGGIILHTIWRSIWGTTKTISDAAPVGQLAVNDCDWSNASFAGTPVWKFEFNTYSVYW